METLYEKREQDMKDIEVIIGKPIGVGHGAIHAETQTTEEWQMIEQAVTECMTVVDPTLPSCCIDGRCCIETVSGEPTQARFSVAGGAAITGYAAAELAGIFGGDAPQHPNDRYAIIDARLNAAGINTGNHVDKANFETQFSAGKTGCGACDRLPENIANVYDEAEGVEGLAAQLVVGYKSGQIDVSRRQAVVAGLRGWDPVRAEKQIENRDAGAIEILESDDTPTHGHTELAVVFNYVEGYTIDRDAFFAKTGKELFVIDMPYIDKIARALAGGPDAEAQYEKLRHAAVEYQLGTYLTLCDGSQAPIIIRPKA